MKLLKLERERERERERGQNLCFLFCVTCPLENQLMSKHEFVCKYGNVKRVGIAK